MARDPRLIETTPDQRLQRRLTDLEGAGRGVGSGLQKTGSSETVFPGGSENSTAKVITHNLGFTPHVQLTITGGGSGFNSFIRITAKSNTTFTVQAFNAGKPASPFGVAFDWLATP